MESIETYLSRLTDTEQTFFKEVMQELKRQGTIDFKVFHNFLKSSVKDFDELPIEEKLRNFIHLWYIEADLSDRLEGHTDIYSNGRTRALSDMEDLIYQIKNRWV
jgi:hypothetical protein